MSVETDLNFWGGYLIEDHFGGGMAGAALAEVSPTTGSLTLSDRIVSAVITPAGPNREEQYELGSDLFPTSIETIGYGPGELAVKTLLQTDDMYDVAISGTKGAIPTTLCWHFDNGMIEFDLFGCYVKSIEFTVTSKTLTLQTVTFGYRSLKIGGAVTEIGYQTGAISTPCLVSCTIDAITSANLIINSLTQIITNEYIGDELMYGLGDCYLQKPALNKRFISISISYLILSSNTWGALTTSPATNDYFNATAQMFNASIVWHTTLTSTMTNITGEGDNSGSNEKGIRVHEQSFKQGAACTIA